MMILRIEIPENDTIEIEIVDIVEVVVENVANIVTVIVNQMMNMKSMDRDIDIPNRKDDPIMVTMMIDDRRIINEPNMKNYRNYRL
ncbi:hypothetical protein BLA29_014894 [Euroglyphus maynei]|uniref:Uncharacterized protein n=1 Tax=Euroglyphus maynei TaxID=6958 RepID=A0A1Y3BEY2_EURMA|nr:hypothetical protein BLA29_014894 [Euroglyphus maynei]